MMRSNPINAAIRILGATIFALLFPLAPWMMNGTAVASAELPAAAPTTGTIPSASKGPITLSLVPNRISGIAPLAVFFDAAQTTSLATTKPFHNIEYRWDFGDPGSGTWTTGSRPGASSRNLATGAVSAHVFETPGTYTVSLTAFDGTNTAKTSVEISVWNPDLVFPGTSTICISNTPQSSGGPTGCQYVTTRSFSDAVTGVMHYIADGKRILLKRGDTFTVANADSVWINASNWTLGAWGSGAKPVIEAVTDNIEGMLKYGSSGTRSNVRWMDVAFSANGHSNIVATSYLGRGPNSAAPQYYSDFLMLRLDVQAMYRGFMTMQQTGVFIVDCTVVSTGYTSFSGGMINSAILGSSFTETELVDRGEGNMRWGNANKLVVSNNDVIGAQFYRQHIKLHSQDNVPSEYIIFSDNKFAGGADAFAFRIGPQNPTSGLEDVQNFVVERNWFLAHAAGPGYTGTARLMQLSGRNGTVRNNLFDFSKGDSGQNWSIVITQEGTEPIPDDIQIYNNTAYSSLTNTNGQGFTMIAVDEKNLGATNIVVRNNYASAPHYTHSSLLFDPHGKVSGANNTNNIITNTPRWVSATPSTPDQFKPAAKSAAIGAGAVVPVWSDFFRRNEPTPRDLGAVNH